MKTNIQVLAFIVKHPTMSTLVLSYSPSLKKNLTRNKWNFNNLEEKTVQANLLLQRISVFFSNILKDKKNTEKNYLKTGTMTEVFNLTGSNIHNNTN